MMRKYREALEEKKPPLPIPDPVAEEVKEKQK
jgi:hypothetical protein